VSQRLIPTGKQFGLLTRILATENGSFCVRMKAFGGKVLTALNNGALCLMLSIGHRTGLFDIMSEPPPVPPIRVPTLGICGAHDLAMLADRIAASERHVSGPWRFELFEDAGHWIPLECPDRLSRLLIEFLGDSRR
jgi:pimeloyl-ACP methyl ester carboxylesterase